jgi:hypothetical protein
MLSIRRHIWYVPGESIPKSQQRRSIIVPLEHSNLVFVVGQWHELHLQFCKRSLVESLQHKPWYFVIHFPSLCLHELRFAFEASSTGALMIATVGHVTTQLSVVEVRDIAMAHETLNFWSEIDLLAHFGRVFQQEFVGHNCLFTSREGEEGDDAVDTRFESVLSTSEMLLDE